MAGEQRELRLLANSAVGLPLLGAMAHRQLVSLLDKLDVARGTLLRLLLAARENRGPELLCLLQRSPRVRHSLQMRKH